MNTTLINIIFLIFGIAEFIGLLGFAVIYVVYIAQWA